MKNKISQITASATILLGLIFSTSGCNQWFDVSPKTDVKAQDLYKTENGYLSALAGLYVTMTKSEVYGSNLSFGLLDHMAQIYDWLPKGDTDRAKIYTYNIDTPNDYNTKSLLASSWITSYNIIANANNLIKWLDQNGTAVLKNEQTRNMVRGEALAVRAYVHFDLLRGWGPIYKDEPTALSIPYRVVADDSKLPLLSAQEIIKRILEDLNEARRLLSHEAESKLIDMNADRRCRLNYHAVNALLARVYCYAGDAPKAVMHAKEALDKCGLDLQVNNADDPAQYREALFAVNLNKMPDKVKSIFAENPKDITALYHSTVQTFNALYETTGTETEDIRAKSSGFIRFNDQGKVLSRKYIQNEEEIIPLIRIPEMYYILCEMSPLSEAAQHLNKVRNKRGFATASNVKINSEEERIRELDKEYRKEFYAEGQYFFFLKRHAFKTFINCPVTPMGKEQYVFQLPDREKEYGWTIESEQTKDSKAEK
ncbi:RagB/SusD family nutrient uptake outer membrane protein [Porphyromonas sp.]|uniref:RagB/SusD family nutrient uptake outer membrane protein n=1 Tax=Porphyromonas sp. TaxID=1924944 RepID=UPI0026DDC5DD|nr:RagB/SusD family nutrient uptake outer membrane protein [Porphyromonas sp.]MDO4771295.1 RagB/SusD family nutrient uptake outer membrane protein [Porphyromonas sp.]